MYLTSLVWHTGVEFRSRSYHITSCTNKLNAGISLTSDLRTTFSASHTEFGGKCVWVRQAASRLSDSIDPQPFTDPKIHTSRAQTSQWRKDVTHKMCGIPQVGWGGGGPDGKRFLPKYEQFDVWIGVHWEPPKDCVVAIVICCEVEVRESNTGGGAKFFAPVQALLYPIMGTGSFPKVQRPRCGTDHTPSSSAEVKERVELDLCFSSGLTWPVIR
jgi:hypothetical protein